MIDARCVRTDGVLEVDAACYLHLRRRLVHASTNLAELKGPRTIYEKLRCGQRRVGFREKRSPVTDVSDSLFNRYVEAQ